MTRARVLTLPVVAVSILSAECEREALLDLREFKRTRKLSADRLARLLGCSIASSKRWLTGECKVPGWVVFALRKLRAIMPAVVSDDTREAA